MARSVDVLTIPLKLRFFEEIATSLNKFLIYFQRNNPMVLCMAEAFDNVLQNLCNRFMRKDVIEKASTTHQLLKADFIDKAKSSFPRIC